MTDRDYMLAILHIRTMALAGNRTIAPGVREGLYLAADLLQGHQDKHRAERAALTKIETWVREHTP